MHPSRQTVRVGARRPVQDTAPRLLALLASCALAHCGGSPQGTERARFPLVEPASPRAQGPAATSLAATRPGAEPEKPRIDVALSLGAYESTAHLIRLTGHFPGAGSPGHSYAPTAYCNGVRLTGSVARMYALIVRQSPTVIDFVIPERPAGSTCSFVVEHAVGGTSKSSAEHGASAARPPIALQPPAIEVGRVDVEDAANGRQRFGLSGRFPRAGSGSYRVEVRCNGALVAPHDVALHHESEDLLTISIPQLPGYRSCTFWAIRRSDGLRSPLRSQRVGNAPPAPPFLGGYFMGGYQPGQGRLDHALGDGVANLADAGFARNVRLRLNPRQRGLGSANTYNFDQSTWEAREGACPPGEFLACAVKSRYYQEAFAVPGLEHVMLTTYDTGVLGERGERALFDRDPAFFTAEKTAAISAEYEKMASALCETQRNTGRTFIISNWEADNQLYACASISRFAECKRAEAAGEPESASCCEVKRNCEHREKRCAGSERPRALTVDESVLAHVAWFDARRRGLERGVARAPGGCDGVAIRDAVEINAYPVLAGLGAKSVLTHVVARLASPPDYVAYSAWSSTSRGRLEPDLARIRAEAPPGSQVILGELGFVYGSEKNVDEHRNELVRAAARSGVPLAFYWQAYPNSGPGGDGDGMLMGLLDDDGSDLYASYLSTAPYGHRAVMSTESLRAALSPPPPDGRRTPW